MKFIISGGGTGGHIYPAVAIANELKSLDAASEFLFVGAEGKMEMQKVPAVGYKIVGLPISGIQRRITAKNLLFPFRLLLSILKAISVIKNFKPDVAIGVGGYASFPLLFAAGKTGVPTVIQEQNSYAGIANKYLAAKAEKICVAYENMNQFFPSQKLVLTGNPVRKDISRLAATREEALAHFGLNTQLKTILIIGGSLGAGTINQSIANKIDKFPDTVQLLWQTGKAYFHSYQHLSQMPRVKVCEFIAEMNLAYAAADIIISRAGALSISELCLVGKPVILVPSPNVAEDHQTKNANALVAKTAAAIIPDNKASELLVNESLALIEDLERQAIYSANIKQLGKPDASKDIANIILNVIGKRK